MQKRLFLLPGFGEDTFCFNELIPFINNHKYEIIHVDYRPVLDKFTFPFITVQQFSRQLIKIYGIQKEDKLLGHSMGGYFSFQIRELIGTEICMIGSFNDPKKVIHMLPQFPRITLLAALTGLVKTNFLKKFLLSKIKDERVKEVQSKIMDNFDNFTDNELALMIEMNYQKKITSVLPNPLRIHDKADRIIAPPDEVYFQVKGGHFCLNLYPQETYAYMKDFLD
jgi:hypothetical protein